MSWAKLTPRANQSGAKTRSGRTGKGNPYLKSALGQAAASAARTHTFLGARYRRLARRIGKLKALVAVARSILVVAWQLLTDPTSRFHDLGAEFYDNRVQPERRKLNHIRQLEALRLPGHPHPPSPQRPDYQASGGGYFPIRQRARQPTDPRGPQAASDRRPPRRVAPPRAG